MKLLLLVALALAGCKKDPAPTGPGNTGGGDPDSPYACAVDDDCVAVELGCCDACNGGEAVGAHKDRVDEVKAAGPRGQGGCTDNVCTELGCADWIPSCEAGRCEIERGRLE